MNYRHIYHAGNFADIHKHFLFVMALDYLQQKDKGLMVLDAFAGIGLYNLNNPEPRKTQEYLAGIAKIMATPSKNLDIQRFQSLIQPYWNNATYPGSPLLAAQLLRPQDRLIANELHPDDVATLEDNLSPFRKAKVTHEDAYQIIRASIPPLEKRGLVLIDPPFEKPNEFELLVTQMAEWKLRWPTGCYMIWYPIKAGQPIAQLHKAAQLLGLNRTWVSEILLQKRDIPEGLNGAGLLVFNAPYTIPERMNDAAHDMCTLLGQGWVESRYLTTD